MKLTFLQDEFVRSGVTIFIATLLASLVSFFANVMISNILGPMGPESFGNFKVIVYLFSFLPIVADFGINSSLTKYISEFGRDCNKARCLIVKLLRIKVVGYTAIVVMLFLFRGQIALYFMKDLSLSYLVIAGIALLASNFFNTFSFIVLGFQNFKVFSLSQFLNAASSAVLALILSRFGLFYIIIGWSLGQLIGSIPSIIYTLGKIRLRISSMIDVRRIFVGFSLPVYPIDLSTNLFMVIIPVLSLFFATELVSYYSFAFMFYYAALLIPNSLSMVLFPKVSELNGLKKYDHAKRILRKSFLYYTLIALTGLVFVAFLSEWLISTVAKEYLPSLLLFKVITSLGFVFGYNIIYTNYLKGLGKVKKYALFTLTQTIILIVISFFMMFSTP